MSSTSPTSEVMLFLQILDLGKDKGQVHVMIRLLPQTSLLPSPLLQPSSPLPALHPGSPAPAPLARPLQTLLKEDINFTRPGLLHVQLIKCTNLNGNGKSNRADAYVKVFVGSKKNLTNESITSSYNNAEMKQSSTKYNSIKPTWEIFDGQFVFYLQQAAADTAVIAQVRNRFAVHSSSSLRVESLSVSTLCAFLPSLFSDGSL
eukprot:748927-Hanusia_phi.AAC.2